MLYKNRMKRRRADEPFFFFLPSLPLSLSSLSLSLLIALYAHILQYRTFDQWKGEKKKRERTPQVTLTSRAYLVSIPFFLLSFFLLSSFSLLSIPFFLLCDCINNKVIPSPCHQHEDGIGYSCVIQTHIPSFLTISSPSHSFYPLSPSSSLWQGEEEKKK